MTNISGSDNEGQTTQQGLFKKKDSPKYNIFNKNQFTIDIGDAEVGEMIYLIERNNPTLKGGFRVPPYTFFKFYFENNNSVDVNINLQKSFLEDDNGNRYYVIRSGVIEKEYSSEAYEYFKKDDVFSLYTIAIFNEHTKDPKRFYFNKFLPDEIANLKPHSSSTQIIAFYPISQTTRKISFVIVDDSGNILSKTEFKYITSRSVLLK